MTRTYQACCLDCDESFMVDDSDSLFSCLLRCDRCGETKSVGFDQLGELQLRYLKSLPGGRCVLGSDHEARVRVHVPVEPIAIEEYAAGVQALAGMCGCGGSFSVDAPPRCFVCRSTNIELGRASSWDD